jgi:hypothetical protein
MKMPGDAVGLDKTSRRLVIKLLDKKQNQTKALFMSVEKVRMTLFTITRCVKQFFVSLFWKEKTRV